MKCNFAIARVAAAGIEVHPAATEYQNGEQEIRVLLPDTYSNGKKYRVLYVLPVEAGFQQQFGYGLGVLQEINAHNVCDIIIVQMGFEKEPWFGDHATDPKTRQAGYLKEHVVPFVEGRYSTLGSPEGRLLFGFSKSGWGAYSLILTYPDYFGYAAAWDAPILFTDFQFGMKQVYGTLEQLGKYRPDLLIPKRKELFQDKTRLVLTGEHAWGKTIPAPGGGSHTEEAHRLMEKENVRHVYNKRVTTAHYWNKAWMALTLDALMRLTGQNLDRNPKREQGAPADANKPPRSRAGRVCEAHYCPALRRGAGQQSR